MRHICFKLYSKPLSSLAAVIATMMTDAKLEMIQRVLSRTGLSDTLSECHEGNFGDFTLFRLDMYPAERPKGIHVAVLQPHHRTSAPGGLTLSRSDKTAVRSHKRGS